MKRTKAHTLETESGRAFQNLLPPEWIFRKKTPDYGIDAEIEIVEDELVTNKVLLIQLKATETKKQKISYQMGTNQLKHYEKCQLPVLIVYWIKPENKFYYIFAQRYIREDLSVNNPLWRDQETVVITFDSNLETAEDIDSIATDSRLYLFPQQLNIGDKTSAIYWLDGIPQSDEKELKERTLKALEYSLNEEHSAAIDELEKILKECVLSPTEKMSVLLSLGNAYYSLSQYTQALDNYKAILKLVKKTDEKSSLLGKSAALGNIGLVYVDKGDLDEALKNIKEALDIDKVIGYRQGEANDLGNIGIIYMDKGDLDEALKNFKEALDIDKVIGYRQGEAIQLGNIGIIYRNKGDLDEALKNIKEALDISREIGYRLGEANDLGNIGLIYRENGDLDEALKNIKEALDISREIGYRQGEAIQLGNIGLIYRNKGDLDEALKNFKEALDIDKVIGYRQGEAIQLGNIGLIYWDKGDLDEALKNFKEALDIGKVIGYRQGEAIQLGNIGIIYRNKGDLDEALKNFKEALDISREIEYRQGEASNLGNIGIIYRNKGDLDEALKNFKAALDILDSHGLTHGRDIIRRAIDSIVKDK